MEVRQLQFTFGKGGREGWREGGREEREREEGERGNGTHHHKDGRTGGERGKQGRTTYSWRGTVKKPIFLNCFSASFFL